VLVFGCTLICSGQEASFKNYNDQNGLPSSEVYQVFQDSKGFIWFSTDNGVVRFDGGEFKLFNKSNGLADAVVFSIIEDPHGNLWFKTFSGLISTYQNGKMAPYHLQSDQKIRSGFRSMVVDSLGQIYLTRYEQDSNYFKITQQRVIEPIQALPSRYDQKNIYIHQISKDGFLFGWAGKPDRELENVYWNGKFYSISIPKGRIGQSYFGYWRGAMYLSIGNLLYRLEGSAAKLVATFKESIIHMSADKNDNFWIGFLSDGTVRFSDETFLHPYKIASLENQSVTSVLHDAEGGFWFSTLEKGVFYMPNDKILSYSLPEDSKMNFAIANKLYAWVGYYNGTLLCFDKRTKKKKWSVDFNEPIVAGVFLEGDSLLLISTADHGAVLNSRGVIVKRSEIDPKKYFKTHDRIWGVSSGEYYEFDLKGNLLSRKPLNFWCRNIFVSGNDFYLPGITGLHKTDRSFQRMTDIDEFANDKISGFAQLPSGRILVTTVGNGFKIIAGNQVKTYSKKEGLIAESIYAAEVDHSIWLGTDKGLLKIDLQLLLDKGQLKYDLLDKTSGLVSDKVNYISRNGNETWCISNDCFSVFDDREIHFANANPVLRLNRLTVNSNPVDSSQLLNLSYGENNIRFEFGFQSYNCRNVFLRHRSSPENPWNYTQDLNVNYHSLAPAHYFFEAEYSTDRTHWRKIVFPNIVIISPVWWETIYFKLTILFVTGLIFFIYFRAKYKASLLKLEMAEKLKSEKKRIAQDLHDNIGSRLVALSHELYHVVKEYEIEASTAEKIYENVNSTVSELRDTIWVIQKEGVTTTEFADKIRNLIRRLKQNNGVIQYDLNITTEDDQRSLKPTQAINLYRIVQEAIANAQKHSRADVLSISVYLDQLFHRLCIKVEDNGKGFDIRNVQLKDHYGLRNMQARADEIAASFEISSNTDRGTQVMVSFQFSE
jgi:signal transduction histidine kinase/ligand-binding sensor domain-containing protein